MDSIWMDDKCPGNNDRDVQKLYSSVTENRTLFYKYLEWCHDFWQTSVHTL